MPPSQAFALDHQVLVKRLARLARIGLTKDEEARYTSEFQAIVEFVSQVERVQAEPSSLKATVTGVRHVVRGDTSEPSALADLLLDQAPDTRTGFLKVPAIL